MTTAFRKSEIRYVRPGNTIFFQNFDVGILVDVARIESFEDEGCPCIRFWNADGDRCVLPHDEQVFIRY